MRTLPLRYESWDLRWDATFLDVVEGDWLVESFTADVLDVAINDRQLHPLSIEAPPSSSASKAVKVKGWEPWALELLGLPVPKKAAGHEGGGGGQRRRKWEGQGQGTAAGTASGRRW